jgi:nickel-type superoxide dismutase maturation protease
VPNQLVKTGWVELFFWLLRLRQRIVVVGFSMMPTLQEGDELLIAHRKKLLLGDIVVLAHPRDSSITIIKRVKRLENDGAVWIEGDNPDESTDSRQFGIVGNGEITGVVTSRLHRKAGAETKA